MGEKRIVSGKLEAYGDEWQIIHPEVAEPGKGPAPAIREPVYPLTEGMTNRRMGELAASRWSVRPSCRNGSSRVLRPANRGMAGARLSLWPTASRAPRRPASGSPMTRSSPTSWPCCCCASRSGVTEPCPCQARAN